MWRLPTIEEWQELEEKCTWEWKTLNGVNGYKVTATNGNYIFLPAAGYFFDDYHANAGSLGFYWSASLNTDYPNYAWHYDFGSGSHYRTYGSRCYGQSVRPVSDNKSEGIDLGLSVNWCEHNWRSSAETDIRKGDYYTFDEATNLFHNNNKMEEKTIEYKGKRYRAVQGACSEDCALWDVCDANVKSEASQLCAEHFTIGEGLMWEEIPEPNHIPDATKMVENRLRPNYYVINGIECKNIIGEFSYNVGAAMKYLWRHGRKTEEGMNDKDKAVEDLKKAIEHIKFEIERISKS